MPQGWIRVWGFECLGIVNGVHCYTVAAFRSYSDAVDFINSELPSRNLYLS